MRRPGDIDVNAIVGAGTLIPPPSKPKTVRADKATWRKGRNGLYYGRITAPNGKIVADYAEGYSTPGACLRALRRDQERWSQPGGLVVCDVPVPPAAKKAKRVTNK